MPHATIYDIKYSRRGILKAATFAAAASTVGASALATAPSASAQGRVLGTVIDYSAGVPSGRAVRAAGHMGPYVMFRSLAPTPFHG
ncbi:hypothetical protein SAMN05661109_01617 [Corynebacterium cystitidis DSM 20524]|uniref:Uncharacterized protein n=1 Tax=Corynebacterium cystitidis DSM 20524 TaxID=1121357 RepID=A0A1H9TYR5_9CORY|nr:hypothetical protein SAMN05661109_01617 [Corynebacterium cystitidis DSM 20524]